MMSLKLHAQAKINYLPADTLLQWFENSENPLDVWDSINAWEKRTSGLTLYDHESYYHSAKLKPYLLKWLDRRLIKEYKIEQYLNENRINMDPDESYDSIDHWLDSVHISNEIKKLLKQQEDSITIDSVLANTELFNSFKEVVIEKNLQKRKVAYQKELNPFPDNRTISFHMNLAYPESYKQVRSYWEETGKGTDRNPYFVPLVKMGDPEARAIYDELVKKTVKNNCEDHFCHDAYSDGRSALRGSYGTAKLIELLEIDQMVDLFGHGDPEDIIPYKCKILKLLISDIFTYKIEVDPVVKYRDPCEEHLKHLIEIKVAAQRLVEYYKEQEYYWMSNMPFYEE
jgi:hypothetical protein